MSPSITHPSIRSTLVQATLGFVFLQLWYNIMFVILVHILSLQNLSFKSIWDAVLYNLVNVPSDLFFSSCWHSVQQSRPCNSPCPSPCFHSWTWVMNEHTEPSTMPLASSPGSACWRCYYMVHLPLADDTQQKLLTTSTPVAGHSDVAESSPLRTGPLFFIFIVTVAFVFPFFFCVDCTFTYAMNAAAEALGGPLPGEDRDAFDIRIFFKVRARLVANLVSMAIS